jgi:hypothetical protein
MEEFFCSQGFECMFRKNISPQKRITVDTDNPKYYEKLVEASKKDFKKVKAAIKILSEIEKEGEYAIPEEIKQIINKTVQIARQAS